MTRPVLGQAVCPIKTVKINSLRGFVTENSRQQVPLANVLVELRSTGDDEVLISSVRTDEKGGFSFGSMKRGKYALDFRHDFLAGYRLIVETRAHGPSQKGSSFLVKLGPDCFTTEVTLGK